MLPPGTVAVPNGRLVATLMNVTVPSSWLLTYAVRPSGLMRTCDGRYPTGNGVENVVDGRSARTAEAASDCVTYTTPADDTATANGAPSSPTESRVPRPGCPRPPGAVPTAGRRQTGDAAFGSSYTKSTHPISLAMTACVPLLLKPM